MWILLLESLEQVFFPVNGLRVSYSHKVENLISGEAGEGGF